jgi:hypothetical protein
VNAPGIFNGGKDFVYEFAVDAVQHEEQDVHVTRAAARRFCVENGLEDDPGLEQHVTVLSAGKNTLCSILLYYLYQHYEYQYY